MFQCIIQPKNNWIHAPNPEIKDAFSDIRLQLNEQLRCLDLRMESQVSLVSEFQDFFRRRAELERDYSKNLDKLATSLQLRHKEQKQKREQWPLFSSFLCWQHLVSQTKILSRDHATIADIYSNHLVARLNQVIEDIQRVFKKCREVGYETHEEILRVLHELHTTMKTFHNYQTECKQAETKLRLAEAQRVKLQQTIAPDKLEKSKKYRLIDKEISKRMSKYTDAKLKALKARNEYALCLEASNTTIHKYFVEDLSDLIDCMDLGFHNCMSRALMMHVSAEECRQKSMLQSMEQLTNCINCLDSRLDKQKFLESNHQAFMIPKKIVFQQQRFEDVDLNEIVEPELRKALAQEMETRLTQLNDRLSTLRMESEEVWKTLETAESTLLEMLSIPDYDCSQFFGLNHQTSFDTISISNISFSNTSGLLTNNATKAPEVLSLKLRSDRQETEEFYLSKFREYLLSTTRIARLGSKQEYLRKTLINLNVNNGAKSDNGCTKANNELVLSKPPIRRKRIGRSYITGQPKLFGGSLEEYLEATNQEIPLIIKSCIRVINLYGLHHQGIFRVSGSQVEINNFREWFERGEDPLADVSDASDINSVAGVLKLYLRELREPLFPIIYFEHLMELAQLDSKQEFVSKMQELIKSLPRSVAVVMRYLFAFLNHLSEYSDENMMDPYNLAICFGPTLVPVPDDKDQVQYQNQVNELIKNIILFNNEIFPNDGGIVYEKYISHELDDNDVGDSPSDHIQDDGDSEIYPSEDESENMEATAQFDFCARSDREVSFKKGDTILLYTQVSNDWWKGSINGQEGLIPDKYISLKMKDEDRDKQDFYNNLKSSSSEESMRHQINETAHSEIYQKWNTFDNDKTLIADSPSSQEKNEGLSSNKKLNISPNKTETENSLNEKSKTTNSTSSLETPSLYELQSLDLKSNKYNWKSSQNINETENITVSFNQNKELWQKRASSHSIKTPQQQQSNESWAQRQKHTPDLVMDLPLTSSGNSSPNSQKNIQETNQSEVADNNVNNPPESPDMNTAAERFAKQNQCTLKKKSHSSSDPGNDNKLQIESSNSDVITSPIPIHKYAAKFADMNLTGSFKPQIKTKPQIQKKPTLPSTSDSSKKDKPQK